MARMVASLAFFCRRAPPLFKLADQLAVDERSTRCSTRVITQY